MYAQNYIIRNDGLPTLDLINNYTYKRAHVYMQAARKY